MHGGIERYTRRNNPLILRGTPFGETKIVGCQLATGDRRQ